MQGAVFNLADRQAIEKGLTMGTGALWLSLTTEQSSKLRCWCAVISGVIGWLKKDGQGYQTRANQMLRERMLKDLQGR
jgi:hypothetical protein